MKNRRKNNDTTGGGVYEGNEEKTHHVDKQLTNKTVYSSLLWKLEKNLAITDIFNH